MSSLDLLSIGRVSVDLYAEQPGVTMSDVTTFRKSIGGTATNVAVATARYGHAVAPRHASATTNSAGTSPMHCRTRSMSTRASLPPIRP